MLKDIKQTPHSIEATSDNKYHEHLRGTIELFDLTDEAFEQRLPEFIQSRVAGLEGSGSEGMVRDTSPSFDSYIHAETSLHPAEEVLEVLPFKIDDATPYSLSLRASRIWYKHLLAKGFSPEKSLLNAAIKGTFGGQGEYFGSVYGHTMKRLHRLDENNNPGCDAVSVAKIGDAAMCMERAAVVHNALLVMGVSNTYCVGKLSRSYDGKVKTEAHAYLEVIGTDGARLIYDPANPKIEKNGEKELATPGVFPVSREYEGKDVVQRTQIVDGVPVDIGEYVYTRNTPKDILGTLALQ